MEESERCYSFVLSWIPFSFLPLSHSVGSETCRNILKLNLFSHPYPTKCLTCFHHVVIKIRQLFLRPAACLTSTLLGNSVLDAIQKNFWELQNSLSANNLKEWRQRQSSIVRWTFRRTTLVCFYIASWHRLVICLIWSWLQSLLLQINELKIK
jgi:hypothetical protein